MLICELTEEAFDLARSQGWYTKPLRDPDTREVHHEHVVGWLAGVGTTVTEVMHAFDDGVMRVLVVGGKPTGVAAECANVLLRVGALVAALGLTNKFQTVCGATTEVNDLDYLPGPRLPAGRLRALLLMHAHVSAAMAAVIVHDERALLEALRLLARAVASFVTNTCGGNPGTEVWVGDVLRVMIDHHRKQAGGKVS